MLIGHMNSGANWMVGTGAHTVYCVSVLYYTVSRTSESLCYTAHTLLRHYCTKQSHTLVSHCATLHTLLRHYYTIHNSVTSPRNWTSSVLTGLNIYIAHTRSDACYTKA